MTTPPEVLKRRQLFRQKLPEYRKDPVLFSKEILGFKPDKWQEEVMMDMANYPKVSVRSGHGVGKTAVESVILIWFLCCFPFPKIIATAPTRQQLNDILWSEVAKWQAKSPVLVDILRWTKTYIFMKGYEKRWFAVAKTAGKPEGMQGFHEDNLLFIVDEASGMEEEIMEAILGTLSGANNKLLMCANPTRTVGTFFDSHNKDRGMYRCHKVSSLDCERTNKENIASFLKKYGAESNVARVRVYGEFPAQEDDVFIPLQLVEASIVNEIDITESISKITLGVDVARYGDDETIIVTNVAGKAEIAEVAHGQNLMRTVGNIVAIYRQLIDKYPQYHGVITAYIDDTGLGGGVTDRLIEVKKEERLLRLEVVPINFASSPPQDGSEVKYNDITTYMWATVRDLMEAKELQVPNDEELVAQLSVRKYEVTSKGKLALESKKDMKDRGIKSPDRADALALSCYSTNRVYDQFIDNEQAIVIPVDAVLAMNIMRLNIGISAGSSIIGASFVATAIVEGYKKVVAIASRHHAGQIETDSLEKHFLQFVKDIETKYKRRPETVFVDKGSAMLNRAIRSALSAASIDAQVRYSADANETERIRATTRLMSQNRFFTTEDCETLSRAFAAATWVNKRSSDVRSDSSDTATLKAFEYTIEREITRFNASE